jgi:hypothetical protein
MNKVMETEAEILAFQINAIKKELSYLIEKLRKIKEPNPIEEFELNDCAG